MCNLNGLPLNIEGYKIVLELNGKFFSPTTGIEYKVGPVEIPEKQTNHLKGCIVSNLLDERSFGYSSTMIGRTCVFLNIDDAKSNLEYWQKYCKNLVILNMTISQDLLIGNYGGIVVGGKNIISFYKYKS